MITPPPALTESVGKPYRDGTHRARSPEETLAWAAHAAAAAGITRVGMLTGLDRLGIPVAAAYRPNSRTIAVHQGKGASVSAAKASAVMEGIETFHAETADLPLRLGSFAEIVQHGAAVDPAHLPRTSPDDLTARRVLWTQGTRLDSGEPTWVPFDLVGLDLTADGPAAGASFQATTNGLGSGNHMLEAVNHALCEIVERDAVALWQGMPPDAQDRQALDLATVDAPAPRAWFDRIAVAGVVVQVWDVSSDIGLPVFACLLAGDDVQPELGFGCHTDRAVALLRAVGEAAQARLTVISGSRDDLPGDGFGDAATRRRHRAVQAWMARPGSRSFHDAPDGTGETLGCDFHTILARLAAAGHGGAVCVDLTRPELGIPVVRVIVPGLEGPWTPPGGGYSPGTRARMASDTRHRHARA